MSRCLFSVAFISVVFSVNLFAGSHDGSEAKTTGASTTKGQNRISATIMRDIRECANEIQPGAYAAADVPVDGKTQEMKFAFAKRGGKPGVVLYFEDRIAFASFEGKPTKDPRTGKLKLERRLVFKGKETTPVVFTCELTPAHYEQMQTAGDNEASCDRLDIDELGWPTPLPAGTPDQLPLLTDSGAFVPLARALGSEVHFLMNNREARENDAKGHGLIQRPLNYTPVRESINDLEELVSMSNSPLKDFFLYTTRQRLRRQELGMHKNEEHRRDDFGDSSDNSDGERKYTARDLDNYATSADQLYDSMLLSEGSPANLISDEYLGGSVFGGDKETLAKAKELVEYSRDPDAKYALIQIFRDGYNKYLAAHPMPPEAFDACLAVVKEVRDSGQLSEISGLINLDDAYRRQLFMEILNQ